MTFFVYFHLESDFSKLGLEGLKPRKRSLGSKIDIRCKDRKMDFDQKSRNIWKSQKVSLKPELRKLGK
jgi:phosphatidylinositol kinase/protein kinase (PI-3  family)